MKRALLLNAVDRGIGGVLIMGHRGTAKSTAVRSLAALLPPMAQQPLIAEVALQGEKSEIPLYPAAKNGGNAPLSVPIVDLPLSATEDRVVGTLDIEVALSRGKKAFEPGLLARAHGGFLYIDEVNLLEDHLVDLLLDVAASSINVVEREGLSVRHPARFVLVGSGNPEEGDLRPQLLDRFGLYTQIVTIVDVKQRMEVIRRSEAFRERPGEFLREWQPRQAALREKITRAREILPSVEVPDSLLRRAVKLCVKLRIDGHRGEITLTRAARSHAALEGRKKADSSDFRRVAEISLRHRLRRDPLEDIDSGEKIRDAMLGLFVG